MPSMLLIPPFGRSLFHVSDRPHFFLFDPLRIPLLSPEVSSQLPFSLLHLFFRPPLSDNGFRFFSPIRIVYHHPLYDPDVTHV